LLLFFQEKSKKEELKLRVSLLLHSSDIFLVKNIENIELLIDL
jgi:hypothetical protein